ncbi:hypothetical protein LTR09_008593 [Extremus antarcticus]|uniref:Uncharacterized protein n=1 Tax=Extremus antarcticus TaxID=702011 RepID=A0AAJ0G6T9_9PEZI|nr:hypothetical protein LTR09_008593 [Extremus antarcticus]
MADFHHTNPFSTAYTAMPPPQAPRAGPAPFANRGSWHSAPERLSRFSDAPTARPSEYYAHCTGGVPRFISGNDPRVDSGLYAPEAIHPAFRPSAQVFEDEAVSPRAASPAPVAPTTNAATTPRFSMFRFGATEESAHSAPDQQRRKFTFGFGKRDSAEPSPPAQPLRRKRNFSEMTQSVVQAGRQLVAGVKRSRRADDQSEREAVMFKTVRIESDSHCANCLCPQPRQQSGDARSVYAATTYSATGPHPLEGLDEAVGLPADSICTLGLTDEETRFVRRSMVAAESDEWPNLMMDVD